MNEACVKTSFSPASTSSATSSCWAPRSTIGTGTLTLRAGSSRTAGCGHCGFEHPCRDPGPGLAVGHVGQDGGAHADPASGPTLVPSRTDEFMPRYAARPILTPPPSETPAARVAKSSTTSSWVIVTPGIITTWLPTVIPVVRVTLPSRMLPGPMSQQDGIRTEGSTTVAKR